MLHGHDPDDVREYSLRDLQLMLAMHNAYGGLL